MLVLDATVIINLGGTRALWILKETTDTGIAVVDEVVDEIRRPPAVTELRQAMEEQWIQLHHLSTHDELTWLATLRQRHPRLGAGETASLAACLAHDWIFASDDRTARRVAATMRESVSVAMSGTIAVLLNAVERAVLDWPTAETLYGSIVEQGFRTSFARLSDALE